MSGGEAELSRRTRLLLACGLAAALAVTVVVLTSLGGGAASEKQQPPPLDETCLRSWNSDRAQRTRGRHQYTVHTYRLVQVARLRDDATVSDQIGDAAGACAVIFAAEQLDPEPEAAVEVLRGSEWGALSASPDVTPQQLGALQARAIEAPNAQLLEDGSLSGLEE